MTELQMMTDLLLRTADEAAARVSGPGCKATGEQVRDVAAGVRLCADSLDQIARERDEAALRVMEER